MKLLHIANLLVILAFHSEDQYQAQAKLGESYAREREELDSLPRLHLRDDKRNLVELEMFGGNPGDEFIPLGLCEGDCDDDDDVSSLCLS